MTRRLSERALALGPLGWAGPEAEWIAFVCLHSGVFARPQVRAYLRWGERRANGIIARLLKQKLAREEWVLGYKALRICAPRIYRTLDTEVLHCRDTSGLAMARRLLSLDHVIERSDLPWLASEEDKIRAFGAMGIDLDVLPVRNFGSHMKRPRRYFSARHPIAAWPDRALFTCIDPGYRCRSSIRAWADAHVSLWRQLRRRGIRVDATIVVRARREAERARRFALHWAPLDARHDAGDGTRDPKFPEHREILALEAAVRTGDRRAIDRHGGLSPCLERITALRERLGAQQPEGIVDRCRVWRSDRLTGGWL